MDKDCFRNILLTNIFDKSLGRLGAAEMSFPKKNAQVYVGPPIMSNQNLLYSIFKQLDTQGKALCTQGVELIEI